jgi:hypothetical protein
MPDQNTIWIIAIAAAFLSTIQIIRLSTSSTMASVADSDQNGCSANLVMKNLEAQ